MVAQGALDWLQTLADGTRIRLLRLLEQEELSVSELCSVVQLPQSTVSRHLKVLVADAWIANRRHGTNHMYRVESNDWCSARSSLWKWVRQQADGPTTEQDANRLHQVMARRSRSEAFFSSTAADWDRLRVQLFGQQLDAYVLAATLSAEFQVAELGCGSAPLSQLIAPYVKEAIAVDSSQAMLSAARSQLKQFKNVRFVQAGLTETGLEEDSLDAAWLVLVLPYLLDPVLVLKEAKRILKPGAPLVIVDLLPHERSIYQQEMGHLRLGVAQSELQRWLSEAKMNECVHHQLPPDPVAKGPALFASVARAEG